MADLYSDIPELSAEQAGILKRRRIAEMLQQKSMQPIESGQAGKYVVPIGSLDVLSKLAQAFAADRNMSEADKAQVALAQKAQGMLSTEKQKVADAVLAQQEMPRPSPAMEGPMPGQAPTLDTQNQRLTGLNLQFPQAEKERETRLKVNEAIRAREDMQEQQRLMRQAQIDAAKAGRAEKPDTAITPVTIEDPKDPNKTLVIDGRSGRVLGSGPKLTQSGTMESKRQFNMQGIGATIKEAEDLLTGRSGKPLPTGSGIGAAWDIASGFMGGSPEGAKEAQSLKAIGGALTAKMPRMEGPQSDKDTQLYREMAAVVGDPTIPRDRRIAALEQVKTLWSKYERLNPNAFDSGQQQSSKRIKFDANGNMVQ